MVEQKRLSASIARFGWTEMPARVLARFNDKYVVSDMGYKTECWVWTAGHHEKGYGRFYLGMLEGKRVWAYAHRIAYEHYVGLLPEDTPLGDHLCEVKTCCNPAHIEPVDNKENLRRARALNPWQTHNQYTKDKLTEERPDDGSSQRIGDSNAATSTSYSGWSPEGRF